MSTSAELGKLTERGREVAEEVAAGYRDTSLEEGVTREECDARADTLGLTMIGRGYKRTAFAVDDSLVSGDGEYVLKIPHELMGYYENRVEVKYWEELPEAARRYLTPVLEHGHGWMLVPYAERDVTSAEILEVWSGLSEAGWACEDANWGHNIGRIGDRPVVIDYGRGCHEYVRK